MLVRVLTTNTHCLQNTVQKLNVIELVFIHCNGQPLNKNLHFDQLKFTCKTINKEFHVHRKLLTFQ